MTVTMLVMNREHQFSKEQRGKFYHHKALFHHPVYLKREIAEFVSKHTEQRGSCHHIRRNQ